jgi:hypothetical protein
MGGRVGERDGAGHRQTRRGMAQAAMDSRGMEQPADDSPQNGFMITMTTMITISRVGTSLRIR